MALQTTSVSGFDQTAWDLFTRYSLRPQLFFDRLANVKATKQSMAGSVVRFTITSDISAATTALTEDVDVNPVTFTDSNVDVTLVEYGNAIKATAKIRGTSYIPVDPVVANLIGYNAGLSVDTIARDVLVAGTNVVYGGDATTRGGAGTGLVAADELDAHDIRKVVADLRNANVAPFGDKYAGFLNPDVSVDLREETGGAGWTDPHNYSAPENVWNGEVGTFNGVRFMETPRLEAIADAGDGDVDVYQTLILGQEALAKAFSMTVSGELPSVRPTPVTDSLWRFVGMGWYWLAGYSRFREAAIRRIETSSSLGDN